MTSLDSELKNISKELKYLSLKRQQLVERKKIQCIFQELRNRAEFGQTGDVWKKACDNIPYQNWGWYLQRENVHVAK